MFQGMTMMFTRRTMLFALPLAATACASGTPETLPPLVSGYRHLTPIRLNVAEVEVVPPAATALRIDLPAPLRPDTEMVRMAEERLVAMGTKAQARFMVQAAEFRREQMVGPGGLVGMFSGDPGERLAVRLEGRLEILEEGGRRAAFVESQARRQRTLPDGTSAADRRRAAEEIVRQAMDDLNVELEFQVRRNLREWLEPAGSAAAPAAGGIEREELPRR
jgi:hypothetical protein